MNHRVDSVACKLLWGIFKSLLTDCDCRPRQARFIHHGCERLVRPVSLRREFVKHVDVVELHGNGFVEVATKVTLGNGKIAALLWRQRRIPGRRFATVVGRFEAPAQERFEKIFWRRRAPDADVDVSVNIASWHIVPRTAVGDGNVQCCRVAANFGGDRSVEHGRRMRPLERVVMARAVTRQTAVGRVAVRPSLKLFDGLLHRMFGDCGYFAELKAKHGKREVMTVATKRWRAEGRLGDRRVRRRRTALLADHLASAHMACRAVNTFVGKRVLAAGELSLLHIRWRMTVHAPRLWFDLKLGLENRISPRLRVS